MTTNRSIVRGLIIAAVLLSVTYGVKHLAPTYISPTLASRLLGILLATQAVFYANEAPKYLSPMSESCDASAEQSLRRFSAWVLVVGGLAYAGVWAVAPLQIANMLASSLLGTAVVIVFVRVAWAMLRRSPKHV
jgi:hypothetical protein